MGVIEEFPNTVSICFSGDEFGYKLTVLAGKERSSKSIMSIAGPTKGATGKFASGCCLDFMEEVMIRSPMLLLRRIRKQRLNIW